VGGPCVHAGSGASAARGNGAVLVVRAMEQHGAVCAHASESYVCAGWDREQRPDGLVAAHLGARCPFLYKFNQSLNRLTS
jgi:hypothetical protein